MPGMDGIELTCAIKSDPVIAGVRLIVLSSMASQGEIAAVRQADVTTYLSKPVRHVDLRRAASEALCPPARIEMVAQPAREEPRLAARILLAEDNAVNQVVALSMLKSFGCHVELAKKGLEAVAAFERERFDAILMDCHMPELDGFDATRAIRALEAAAHPNRVRMPVIALTANAMEGDRDRCLASGMDDYLAKPFRHSQLWAVLTNWITSGTGVASAR